MPSPKSLRAAPSREFSKYILTCEIGSGKGLLKFDFKNFSLFNHGPNNATSNPNADDDLGGTLEHDIGFPFDFNGTTYTKFVANANGLIVLVDPTQPLLTTQYGTESFLHVGSGVGWANNAAIRSDITQNLVVLAPWFNDLRNLTFRLSDRITTGNTSNSIGIIERGVGVGPISGFDWNRYGCRYFRTDKTRFGRCLIVRWHSTNQATVSSVRIPAVRFEVVLYENGRIEYRYDPREEKLGTLGFGVTNATVGIFIQGNNNFRDFAPVIPGYRKLRSRKVYPYGGSVYDPNFSMLGDNSITKYYETSLDVDYEWPGSDQFPATITFQPPLNRRKILPRKVIRELDSMQTYPASSRPNAKTINNLFDDRDSIPYVRQIVNYPTTLPRFFGDGASTGVSDRQDLFTGDFEITGSIVKSLVQDYLVKNQKEVISPFKEVSLFEQTPQAQLDPFFMTGSSVAAVGPGFTSPLRDKTQIKLTFPVAGKTTMFELSSSIYYYNKDERRWQWPTASFGPNDDVSAVRNPYQYYTTDEGNNLPVFLEVDHGFNAFGFPISSGTLVWSEFPGQSDYLIGGLWSPQAQSAALSQPYNNSVSLNRRYRANEDESFTLPIIQPFLLEKAIIEIPIEAGPGWFNDNTRCAQPVGPYDYSGCTIDLPVNSDEAGFDVGGPALTVALFNQVRIGKDQYRRDLILSGTVTHLSDSVSALALTRNVNQDVTYDPWQLSPIGFPAYGGTPTVIVSGTYSTTPTPGHYYTGSVLLKCEAAVSNGVVVRESFQVTRRSSPNLTYHTGAIDVLFDTPQWKLGSNNNESFFGNLSLYQRNKFIIGINPFGRAGTGFEPSGRSVFNKEFACRNFYDENLKFDNKFYKYKSSGDKQAALNILNGIAVGGDIGKIFAHCIYTSQANQASPYLVLPNDRLILSISKSRPYFENTYSNINNTSGSVSHDIKLSTGSINITLYGSYITNGREYHDSSPQQTNSAAIHEVIFGDV